MDARTFLSKTSREEAQKIAQSAGTNYVYFTQIASGYRKPSARLARKLVEASEGKLTLQALRPDIYPEQG